LQLERRVTRYKPVVSYTQDVETQERKEVDYYFLLHVAVVEE
jgi:hypothetical protein